VRKDEGQVIAYTASAFCEESWQTVER